MVTQINCVCNRYNLDSGDPHPASSPPIPCHRGYSNCRRCCCGRLAESLDGCTAFARLHGHRIAARKPACIPYFTTDCVRARRPLHRGLCLLLRFVLWTCNSIQRSSRVRMIDRLRQQMRRSYSAPSHWVVAFDVMHGHRRAVDGCCAEHFEDACVGHAIIPLVVRTGCQQQRSACRPKGGNMRVVWGACLCHEALLIRGQARINNKGRYLTS